MFYVFHVICICFISYTICHSIYVIYIYILYFYIFLYLFLFPLFNIGYKCKYPQKCKSYSPKAVYF